MEFIGDQEKIEEYVKDGLISKRKHPFYDLYIYNYTPKVQYEQLWDEVTLNARGLILDGKGKLVARSFPKFFNYQEVDQIPNESFEAFEKLDGSLGICFHYNKKWRIATRGSFDSEQAKEA